MDERRKKGKSEFRKGDDGADKQLGEERRQRRRQADASMDQSDTGLPQPWLTRTTRQASEGLDFRVWVLH